MWRVFKALARESGVPGDADEMDVVAHRAVGPDGEAELGRTFAEHVEVAAVVAALEDMMRISGGDGAGDSAHRSRFSSDLRG